MSHLSKLFFIFLILAISSCTGPSVVGGLEGGEHPKIYTQGEAERRIEPNMANIVFAVLTRASNAEKAREENATKAAAVVAKLKELKIPEEDLQTLDFRIQEVRNYQNGSSKIDAYEVLSRMQLKVKDVKSVGKLIDQLVPLGANKIESVEFDVIEKEEIYRELLAEATSMAKDKAVRIADAAGLGKISVLEAKEEMRYNPAPMYRGGFMAEAKSVDVSTPMAGATVLKANVSLTAVKK